jgi:hypothetical protein
MLGRVLLVVDASIPADAVAVLVSGLVPKPAGVVVLQVVPQIPLAWIAWPALPNAAEEMERASGYVSEAAGFLRALGWNPSTRVYFSPLSAAEMDQEILRQAEMLRPDLICLALERGSVRAGIVRKATVSVLVANPSPPAESAGGLVVESRGETVPVQGHDMSLWNPVRALVVRQVETV